jgi:NMD protein affecting ribosome stability and mRNA decay
MSDLERVNPNLTVMQSPDAINKIFVVVEGQEYQRNLAEVGLNFDDSDQTIMDAIVPIIREAYGIEVGNSYKVRKSVDSRNVFIIPSSTAGAF